MFDRRRFLGRTAQSLAALASVSPWQSLLSRATAGQSSGAGYGPLDAVDDETTGLPLLRLPKGFRYLSYGWTGDSLSDGRSTPGSHDGMAVVRTDGERITLVRNHEIKLDRPAFGPDPTCYDPMSGGGTTNLIFNTASGRFEKSWVSLSGTCKNCAGGPTPWGSWLTCEETVYEPGDREEIDPAKLAPAKAKETNSAPAKTTTPDAKADKPEPRQVKFTKPHGWIFDVPAAATANVVPLTDMGRFVHEAIAVDPATGIVYETEDHKQAGFYRFVPREPGGLRAGGKLQMLRAKGRETLIRDVSVGRVFDVEWIDIPDPTQRHSSGKFDGNGVFAQGHEHGGAMFRRLEGCWYHGGLVFFVSTSGGDASRGQIWEYSPRREQLRLLFESPGADVLNMPDNITVSPRFGLVLCQDSDAKPERLHGLTLGGELFTLAENNIMLAGQRNGFSGDFRDQEWCGATFSPDGRWLFVNIQTPGLTLAITGPWERGAL